MDGGAPLVGRVEEAAVLRQALARARRGDPQVVLVTGEAGVGKSFLVGSVLEDEADLAVLSAQGEPGGTDVPYGVLDQLLASAGPARAADVRRPAGLGPGTTHLAAGAHLLDVLGRLQEDGAAVVVLLDDLQWADEPSVLACVYAARRLHADRVLVLGVARAEEALDTPAPLRRLAAHPSGRTLELAGLPRPKFGELLAARTTRPLPRRVVDLLWARTGGSPLWGLALLDELRDAPPAQLAEELPAPRPFADLVRERLLRCSGATQDLVAAVAVLGGTPPATDAAAVAGLPDPWAAVDEAVRGGLLRSSGPAHAVRLSCAHPLTAAAVHQGLDQAARTALHRRAAELSADEDARLRHLLAAADGPDAGLAARLAQRAQEHLAAGALRLACSSCAAAAQVAVTAEDRRRWLEDAADVALVAGDAATAQRLLDQRGDRPPSPRTDLLDGRAAFAAGRFGAARVALLRAWESAGPDDRAVRAGAALCLSHIGLFDGEDEACMTWGRRAVQDDPGGMLGGAATGPLAIALLKAGRADDALAVLAWVADDGPPAPHEVDPLGIRGMVLLLTDQLQAAHRALAPAADVAKALGSSHLVCSTLAHLAELHHRAGRWDEAEVAARDVLDVSEDLEQRWVAACVTAMTVVVPARRGQWALARARLRQAVEQAAALPTDATSAYVGTAAVLLAHARGDSEAVLRASAPLLAIAHRPGVSEPGHFQWRELHLEAMVRTGALARAERELRAFEEVAADRGRASAIGAAARVRGLLLATQDEDDAAQDAFRTAIGLADDLGMPFEAALARLEAGEHLRRTGRRAAADVLATAHATFSRLGAAPFVQRASRELLASGRRSPVDASPSASLTPQERAVARLVADGLDDREIAARLVLSTRTVEVHRSSALRKLGVRSSSQLVRRVLEQDGLQAPATPRAEPVDRDG